MQRVRINHADIREDDKRKTRRDNVIGLLGLDE